MQCGVICSGSRERTSWLVCKGSCEPQSQQISGFKKCSTAWSNCQNQAHCKNFWWRGRRFKKWHCCKKLRVFALVGPFPQQRTGTMYRWYCVSCILSCREEPRPVWLLALDCIPREPRLNRPGRGKVSQSACDTQNSFLLVCASIAVAPKAALMTWSRSRSASLAWNCKARLDYLDCL